MQPDHRAPLGAVAPARSLRLVDHRASADLALPEQGVAHGFLHLRVVPADERYASHFRHAGYLTRCAEDDVVSDCDAVVWVHAACGDRCVL